MKMIEKYRRIIKMGLGEPDGERWTDLREIIAELQKMVSPTAELSATARACIEKQGRDVAFVLSLPPLAEAA